MKCLINRTQFDAIERKHRLHVATMLLSLEYATQYPEGVEAFTKSGRSFTEHSKQVLSKYTNRELDCMAAAAAERLLEAGFTEENLAAIVLMDDDIDVFPNK